MAIAGMGGETIAGILQRAPWTSGGARLVLQPQSKISELCRWLAENGYALRSALLSREGGRLYLALLASGGEGGYTSAEEALFASGDPLLGEWLDVRISRAQRALNGMESAAEERDTSGVQAELWRLLEIRRKIS